MHAKTDSEGTSIDPSSPTRRPMYFVQSPSRESNDGEKTISASFHSTPIISPAGSPPHSHSSIGRHSRESSASRFSGSLKPAAGPRKGNPKKRWSKEVDVIEEEGLLEDANSRMGISRRCYFLAFVICFFVLFSFFSLILWGASRSQKPKVSMLSITFEEFKIQAGTDSSGVATDMISINSTAKMIYRNTGAFFGVHVSSSSVDLSYSEQISVASGTVKKFYQPRKSKTIVIIPILGKMVPLYGNMGELSSTSGIAAEVPLDLKLTVRSRAYVLGKLVKTKFYKEISCRISVDTAKLNTPIALKNACSYQ